MGLFLGFFAILLVLFMVGAMALAEWADMDPGEAWQWLKKRYFPHWQASVVKKKGKFVQASKDKSKGIVSVSTKKKALKLNSRPSQSRRRA
jgi:hypothetical protein